MCIRDSGRGDGRGCGLSRPPLSPRHRERTEGPGHRDICAHPLQTGHRRQRDRGGEARHLYGTGLLFRPFTPAGRHRIRMGQRYVPGTNLPQGRPPP